MSAVTTLVLIRALSVSDYAFVVLFWAVGQTVGLAATGGVRLLYLRTEAERVSRGEPSETSFDSVLLTGVAVIAATGVAGFLVATMLGVGEANQRLEFVTLATLFSIGQASVDLGVAHYQAHLAFARGGLINVARTMALLIAACITGVILSTSGVVTAAALAGANIGAGVLAAIVLTRNTRNQRKASERQKPVDTRRLSFTFNAEAAWLTIYSLASTGFAMVDVFIVAIVLNQTAVATFGAAQRYYLIVLGAAPALGAVLRVRTAQRDIVDSPDAQVRALRLWMRRSVPPALALTIGGGVLAPLVIPLIDGGRYPTSIPVFQILLGGVFIYYVTLPAANLLMVQRRYRTLAIAFAIAFVVNAVGDLALGSQIGVIGIAVVATTVLVVSSLTMVRLALRLPASTTEELIGVPSRYHATRRFRLRLARSESGGFQGWQWFIVSLIAIACGVIVAFSPLIAVLIVGSLGFCIITWLYPKVGAGISAVVILSNETLKQITGIAAFSTVGDAIVAALAILVLTQGYLLGRSFRFSPGLRWFGLYLASGTVSTILVGGSATVAILDVFLLMKGVIFGVAVAQLDWKATDISRIIRVGAAILIIMLLATGLNALIPGPWGSIFAGEGNTGGRFGLPSLIGPFTYPVSLGHVMALAAIAIIAYQTTLGRSSKSRALFVGAVIATILSARRKAFIGLLAGGIGARLTFIRGRLRTVIVLIIIIPVTGFVLWDSVTSIVRQTSAEYINNSQPVAREIFYRDSMRLARKELPFGVGFGRYAGYAAAINYSPVYDQLGYAHVPGLQRGGHFLTDTFWPAILGEAGILGFIGYLGGLISMLGFSRRMVRSSSPGLSFLGLVGVGWWIEFAIESIASPVYNSPPAFPLLFGVVGIMSAIGVRKKVSVASGELASVSRWEQIAVGRKVRRSTAW